MHVNKTMMLDANKLAYGESLELLRATPSKLRTKCVLRLFRRRPPLSLMTARSLDAAARLSCAKSYSILLLLHEREDHELSVIM